ncbi:MAG: class I SAM-dependent methyltransferase [Pseudomonadota bacterium]|nr:class I SAM-dependent methyltransferase [Pseudomonadota bacterium]
MNPALSDLLNTASQICREDHFKKIILRHCSCIQHPVSPDRLHAEIHPSDQMLIHSLQHHQDAEVALSQYFNISLQQHASAMQVYKSFFDQGDRSVDVLDFACGYGRLLRLLTLSIPASQIWASEIQPDAVEFVAHAFGVQAVPSHLDPEQFRPEKQFDFIWVASLFSHLPEHLFTAWMNKLTSLLTPRGVLCFSIRSGDLLPPAEALPEAGILYFATSEITDLDADVYGTTYVSEAYVRRTVSEALGAAHPCHRLRKALAHEQDLYVVCKDPNRGTEGLEKFRRGPWGWVDRRAVSSDGELDLQGWAASLDDGSVDSVEIRVNDELHECVTNIRRDDVQQAMGDERLAVSGWAFRMPLSLPASTRLEVSARTAPGELALLFAGHADSRASPGGKVCVRSSSSEPPARLPSTRLVNAAP